MVKLLSKRIGGTKIIGNIVPEYIRKLSNSLNDLCYVYGAIDKEEWLDGVRKQSEFNRRLEIGGE